MKKKRAMIVVPLLISMLAIASLVSCVQKQDPNTDTSSMDIASADTASTEVLTWSQFQMDPHYLFVEQEVYTETTYYGVYDDVIYQVSKDDNVLGKLRMIRYHMLDSQTIYYHMALFSEQDFNKPLVIQYEPSQGKVISKSVSGNTHVLNESANARFVDVLDRYFFISAHQNYLLFDGYYKRLSSLQPSFTDNRWFFELAFGNNTLSEYWMIDSAVPLVDWNDQKEIELLRRMDYDVNRQYSVLGNLYPVPSSYSGAGDDHFWNNYAYHVGNRLMLEGTSLFSHIMEGVNIQQLIMEYPDEGYYVTPMKSEWLVKDYLIQGDFYDTRFNSDAAQFLANAYQKTENERVLAPLHRHIDFFKSYAQKYRIPTSEKGFLVMDYSDFSDTVKVNHASLNHTVMEAILLYDHYLITGDTSSRILADQLIQGLVDLGGGWMKPNGDLWYAFHPDLGFILQDYIDVTLNDLVMFQAVYQKVYGVDHPFMVELLKQKQNYVNQHHR